MQKPESDLRTLINLAGMKARATDGHLTIFRFTHKWKVMLGTPDLDTEKGRDQVDALRGHESLPEALSYLIIGEQEV